MARKKLRFLVIIVKQLPSALFYFSKYHLTWVTALPIDPRTTSQMDDVSLNFPSFQRSSSLKAVVNWCQSNPEYTLMESIYQPGNKKPNMNWGYFCIAKMELNRIVFKICHLHRPANHFFYCLSRWEVDSRSEGGERA